MEQNATRDRKPVGVCLDSSLWGEVNSEDRDLAVENRRTDHKILVELQVPPN